MSDSPFISIIMPIRNEALYIEKAVMSVLNNDYPAGKMEILVIDGMSDDGTRDILRDIQSRHSNVRVIDNEKKIVPFAMNIGLREMKGEYFIRLDGHAEMEPDFIKSSIHCLQKHPEAWIVGGYIKTVADTYMGQAIAAAMCSPVGVGNSRFRLGDYEGWVDTLAFGTHHKWILDKIGYFDEELVRNQDDDFNLRVNLAGGKIWLSKSIRSIYYTRGSLSKLWRQYFQYGFWRIRTMQKHKRPATLRQVVPLIFVSSILFLALSGWVWKPMWLLLAGGVGLYVVGILAGALGVGRKAGWKYMPPAPVIFSILHFAYGVGSLWGIVRLVLLKGKGMKRPEQMQMSR